MLGKKMLAFVLLANNASLLTAQEANQPENPNIWSEVKQLAERDQYFILLCSSWDRKTKFSLCVSSKQQIGSGQTQHKSSNQS